MSKCKCCIILWCSGALMTSTICGTCDVVTCAKHVDVRAYMLLRKACYVTVTTYQLQLYSTLLPSRSPSQQILNVK